MRMWSLRTGGGGGGGGGRHWKRLVSGLLVAAGLLCVINLHTAVAPAARAPPPATERIPASASERLVKPAACQNHERLSHLERQCCTLRNSDPHMPTLEALRALPLDKLRAFVHHFIVDEKHRLVYCSIPKTGCSLWKFYILDNLATFPVETLADHVFLHTKDVERFGLLSLRNYNSTAEILHRLDTYYKLIVVRNPMERLYSTYVDKLRRINEYYKRGLGVDIIKKFREQPSNHSLHYGDDVTFEEFLKWVWFKRGSYFIDPHWRSYLSICSPCTLQYDYVAKLDTNGRDSDFIIDNRLSSRRTVNERIFHRQQKPKPRSALGKVMREYADVDDHLLADILDLYRTDMELFGYGALRDVGSKTLYTHCGNGLDGCC